MNPEVYIKILEKIEDHKRWGLWGEDFPEASVFRIDLPSPKNDTDRVVCVVSVNDMFWGVVIDSEGSFRVDPADEWSYFGFDKTSVIKREDVDNWKKVASEEWGAF